MSEFMDWYNAVPFFTRHWVILSLLFSILGCCHPHLFVLDYYLFLHDYQVWRPITALFYCPLGDYLIGMWTRVWEIGFLFFFNCYFMFHYSRRLENGVFLGKPADYFFFLLFNWTCCVVLALLIGFPCLMSPMVLSIVYVWCALNKDARIETVWFGTSFRAVYLPWVMVLTNLLMKRSIILEVLGIIVGHAAYYLTFKFPLLRPPSFLKQLLPDAEVEDDTDDIGVGVRVRAVYGGAPVGPGGVPRHNWGKGGHTLRD
ncbi:der1-like family domain-containing protein [Phthorimaea operculella]|nr:der1-like family domain-containing protein [Phthorimaea operculella]